MSDRGGSRRVAGLTAVALGLKGTQRARDLWRQRDLGTVTGRLEASVPRHGVALVRLWATE